jgi:hypothetical protein
MQQQAPAAGDRNNEATTTAAAPAPADACILDSFLSEQAELTQHPAAHVSWFVLHQTQHAAACTNTLNPHACVQAPLLPSVHNISRLHLPGERLLQLAKLQQWLQDKLCLEEVPITNGCYVLVSTADLSADPLVNSSSSAHDGCAGAAAAAAAASSSTSAAAHAAAAAALPLRLRQVAALQVPSGVAAADAVCVLEGGQRVRAGAVVGGQLQDLQDAQVRFFSVRY